MSDNLDAKAALKRKSVGNAAAMREALEKIEKMAHCDLSNVYPKYRDMFNDKIGGIEREARAALAKPPRNCDVGTAEAQCQRMFHYCIEKGDCSVCERRKNMSFRGCVLDWAQMPYEEGGSK